MDESKKKRIMIVVIGICFTVTLSIIFWGGGKKKAIQTGGTVLLCKSCNESYEISYEQYKKALAEATGTAAPFMPSAVKCEKCGQKTAYQAMKCVRCGKIFVLGDAGDRNFTDKCPACGYSSFEEGIKSMQ